MKIPPRQIENFIKKPDSGARVILVYGPNYGLMKEQVKSIGKTIVEDLNDPFNAVVLSTEQLLDDPARLCDEASAISMMGGNRLIRIENASDKLTPLVKDYLQNPSLENLVVLEAGPLGPKSSLRKLIEKEKQAAALPCYIEEGREISVIIRKTLQDSGIIIEADALNWLTSSLAGDRQRVINEIEKLVTYMGTAKKITLNDAQACCGAAGIQDLDNLVYNVAGARPAQALETYHHLLQEGVPIITVLRSLQNHFRRLHYTKSCMEEGKTIDQAMKMLNPPVFFKKQPAFKAQMQRWPLSALEKTMERLAGLEAQSKKTGFPAETLCSQALLAISNR